MRKAFTVEAMVAVHVHRTCVALLEHTQPLLPYLGQVLSVLSFTVER